MGLLDGDLREVFGSVFAPLLLDAVITRVTLVPDGAGGLTETTVTADAKGMIEQYSAYERARLGVPATDVKLILLQKDVPVRIDVHSKVLIRGQLYSVQHWNEDPAQASWTVQARPILSAAGTGGAIHHGRLPRYRLAASASIPTIADHSGQLRRAVLLALGASGTSTAAHEGMLRRGALSANGAPGIIIDHSGALARMVLAAAGTTEEEGAAHSGRLARMDLTASGAPAIGGQAEGRLGRATLDGIALSRGDGEAVAEMARGGISAYGSVPVIGESMSGLQKGVIAAFGAPAVTGAAVGALRRAGLMTAGSPAVTGQSGGILARTVLEAEGAVADTEVLWTPASYDGALGHWYDASDSATLTLTGSDVIAWADKSGEGHDLSQATPSRRGIFTPQTADFNDLPTVAFPTGGGMAASTKTAGLVFSYIVDGYSSSMGLSVGSIGATAGWSLPENIVSSVRVPAATLTTANVLHRVNGATLSNTWDDGGSTLTAPITAFFAGRISSYGQGTDYGRIFDANGTFTLANRASDWARTANKQFAELIIVPGFLDTSAIELFEGYLAHKWGLQAQLPVDHPYRDIPPHVTG